MSGDDVEALVMRRVLGELKRRRGCLPTPEVLAELSTFATTIANRALGELGRADLGPAVATVSVDQPPRDEPIALGVRLGVARITIDYRDPEVSTVAVDYRETDDPPDEWL